MTLLQFPGGKGGSYDVPDGITGIGASAFDYNPNLTSITIPGSVAKHRG